MPDFDLILAFDFGTHRIGIAAGQSLTGTANALKPIPAKDGIPNWDDLAGIIEEWQPGAFVVGIPLNMDGSDNEITVRARKFKNRLQGRFHKPCFGMDERLSSFEAKTRIIANTDRGKRSNPLTQTKISIDSLAAKLILESWFSEQQAKPQKDQPADQSPSGE